MKVKIIGAGSVGNHMAHAARSLNWDVCIVDTDPMALSRTFSEIYPNRYGAWDSEIKLFTPGGEPSISYDLVIIGTPPDTHLPLAVEELRGSPKAILIEKPLSSPYGADLIAYEKLKTSDSDIFVGYDHLVGAATQYFFQLLQGVTATQVVGVDVSFRESWNGILDAHPWLSGPGDSYLGVSSSGGGALSEHSHGLSLLLSVLRLLDSGRIINVSAHSTYTDQSRICDSQTLALLETESGIVGRLVQDVVTMPPVKSVEVYTSQGRLEWSSHIGKGYDKVLLSQASQQDEEHIFKKTRPDDFISELRYIEKYLGSAKSSVLSLEHGIEVMNLVNAIRLSVSRDGAPIKLI